jgi:hypothetical protein
VNEEQDCITAVRSDDASCITGVELASRRRPYSALAWCPPTARGGRAASRNELLDDVRFWHIAPIGSFAGSDTLEGEAVTFRRVDQVRN